MKKLKKPGDDNILVEHPPIGLTVKIVTEMGFHTEVLSARVEDNDLIIKAKPWLYLQPIPVVSDRGQEVFRLKTDENGAIPLDQVKQQLEKHCGRC